MSDFLRFTPGHYQLLCRACRNLPLCSSYVAFQGSLAAALRGLDEELARRIGRLTKRQIRTLRTHMEAKVGAAEPEPTCELSYPEWRAVSAANALLCLSGDCPKAFRKQLLGEVRAADPVLAKKLRRLDEGQVATLYKRLKAGKRWCP